VCVAHTAAATAVEAAVAAAYLYILQATRLPLQEFAKRFASLAGVEAAVLSRKKCFLDLLVRTRAPTPCFTAFSFDRATLESRGEASPVVLYRIRFSCTG
jgi:hypothetical protein